MNLGVRADDERRIEVLAQDHHCFNGAQLPDYVTLLSALCGSGPQPGAAEQTAVLFQARHKGENLPGAREWEAVPTCGCCHRDRGRWSEEAADLLAIAQAEAREAPTLLAHAAACMGAEMNTVSFAESLVATSDHTWCHTGGETPSLADVLSQDPR